MKDGEKKEWAPKNWTPEVWEKFNELLETLSKDEMLLAFHELDNLIREGGSNFWSLKKVLEN